MLLAVEAGTPPKKARNETKKMQYGFRVHINLLFEIYFKN
jgi:hypothetical protein